LVALLIIKEVAYASALFSNDLSFRWLRFSDFVNAARWDGVRQVNHDFLDDLAAQDFLVLDDIDFFTGGHNNPVDMATVENFFYKRDILGLPTIFVISQRFWKRVQAKLYRQDVENFVGKTCCQIITRSGNVVIMLERFKLSTGE